VSFKGDFVRLILLICLLFSFSAQAKEKGVGISLGNPTGLNGKYWLDSTHAIDGGLAWSLGKGSDFSIHSDYLLHKQAAFYFNDIHPLDFYYGIGGRMEFADEIELGVRVPFGLAHRFEAESADVFGEVAPIVDLVGRNGLELHLMIGGRYYFD